MENVERPAINTSAFDSIETGTRTPAMRAYLRTTSTRRVQNDGRFTSRPSMETRSALSSVSRMLPTTSMESERRGVMPTRTKPSSAASGAPNS